MPEKRQNASDLQVRWNLVQVWDEAFGLKPQPWSEKKDEGTTLVMNKGELR